MIKTSLKGFSASKCNVGNWIFLRNCLEILGFFGILGGIFGIFLKEIFWKDLLGGFFGEDYF